MEQDADLSAVTARSLERTESDPLGEAASRASYIWLLAACLGLAALAALVLGLPVFGLSGDETPQPTPSWVGWTALALLAVIGAYVVATENRYRRLKAVAEAKLIAAERGHFPLRDAEALAEASGALTAGLPLDETLEVILAAAVGLLQGTEGSIMLADPDGKHLETICYRGSSDRYEPFARIKIGEGIAGRVAKTREGIAIAGPADPAEFEGLVEKSVEIHSAICVPLVSRGQLIGVLNVGDTEGGRDFDESDLTTLQIFADDAAVAIVRSAGVA